MDNLFVSFVLHIRTLMDEAKAYAKAKEAEYIAGITLELPKLVTFLNWFSSDTIKPDITYEDFSQEGFKILPKEKQAELANYIAGIAFDKTAAEWEYYEKASQRIAMYLRPVLLTVDFTCTSSNSTIVDLMDALREHYSHGRPPSRLAKTLSEELLTRIAKADLPHLQNNNADKTINAARFEAYVYKKMFHLIDRGKLHCNESVSYCDLKIDLVDDDIVDDTIAITEKMGYPKIAIYCEQYLDDKLDELEAAWQRTNRNIQEGNNEGIQTKILEDNTTTWTLTYDTEDVTQSHFFDGLTPIDVTDALKLMGDKVKAWPVFLHLKDRYTKRQIPERLLLLACLLAKGFGFETDKMAKMSNVSYNELRAVDEDFMYAENLANVNDVVSNFIYNLPVLRAWDLKENTIVGDGDGQKYETRHHTVQSRYSSKYFGTYKGISVYSLVANYIAVNSRVIGPNEHESHYLYDILYNNRSNVNIDMITGDTHSRNQINHVALDSINIAFIPSIKNIREEADKLYSVNDPSEYEGLIQPCGKIDVALIRSEKRNIVRVLLSLLLQKNTQAVIIRKLASHKRYSRLRAALWEYNKIFHSIHLLNVINDGPLRKVIKTARNRTESYHQLQRTIHGIYSGVFKGKRIANNAAIDQASRLIANFIIAYNAMLLNEIYLRLIKKVGKKRADEILAKISPIAWVHIIFTGRYDFRNDRGGIDIDKLIAILEEKLAKTL